MTRSGTHDNTASASTARTVRSLRGNHDLAPVLGQLFADRADRHRWPSPPSPSTSPSRALVDELLHLRRARGGRWRSRPAGSLAVTESHRGLRTGGISKGSPRRSGGIRSSDGRVRVEETTSRRPGHARRDRGHIGLMLPAFNGREVGDDSMNSRAARLPVVGRSDHRSAEARGAHPVPLFLANRR